MVNYRLDAQHVDLSETDRSLLDKKINRLEKYIREPYVMDVRLTRSAHHLRGDVYDCIVNLEHKKDVWHAERQGESVQDAVDDALNALQQLLKRGIDKERRREA